MGILLALGSAIFFALSIFIGKVALKQSKYPDAIGVIYQFIAGIACLGFIFQDGMKFQNVEPISWILLIISTYLYAHSTILSFRCTKVLDVSLISIIAQMTLLFGFFGSILIFKENLTVNKIIGVLFILLGNIIVVFGAKFNKTYSKMIIIRVLVCVIIAAANMLDAYNGKNFPLSFYMFFGYFGGGIIAYFLSKVSINKIKNQLKQNLIGQLLMGILAALGYFCFLQAFNYAEKSIVIPISYVNSILVVILGIVFLKERKFLWKKIFAIIVVFLGSVFVNL